jgi:hypothetical protein
MANIEKGPGVAHLIDRIRELELEQTVHDAGIKGMILEAERLRVELEVTVDINEKLRAELETNKIIIREYHEGAERLRGEIELGRKVDALSARVAALEAFTGVTINEAKLDPAPAEWPEVKTIEIAGTNGTRGVIVGLDEPLTRAQAEAVIRAYRWMMKLAGMRDHRTNEIVIDPKTARRILAGGGR